MCPVDPSTLTATERKRALNAVTLIKQKRDGSLKGFACADGRKQRKYLSEDTKISSPTVSVEEFFTTLLIDAYEGRHVATFDVTGAFLQPELPEQDHKVVLKLRGMFVDIMCRVNPEYQDTVIYEGGVKVLYMRVLRSIYGCIEAAMLWYDLYTTKLKDMGFELNPYDVCIANKIINGKKCTIAWHVEDNKVSQADRKIVEDIILELETYSGKFTIVQGGNQNYLGMNIEVRKDKKLLLK